MDFNKDKIFFIIPCYNEENRFVENFWLDLIKENNIELVFVNDGSKDNTLEKIINLKSKSTKISVIDLNKNIGKSEAIRKGINHIFEKEEWKGGMIGYLDADCAFAQKDVQNLIQLSKNSSFETKDLFIGSRVALQGKQIIRNNLRHIISRVLVTLFGMIYRGIPYDIQSGLKIFRLKSDEKVIFKEKFRTRWFVDFEILLRLTVFRRASLKIWEEPVSYWKDVKGSKINFKEKFRIIYEIIYISYKIMESKKWI